MNRQCMKPHSLIAVAAATGVVAAIVLILGSCVDSGDGRTRATSGGAVASTPATALSREYECRWASRPIVVDGNADEVAWKDAQPAGDFYLPWLGQNSRPANAATHAWLLWDRQYLYFFADMRDADLHTDIREHDGRVWTHDAFELFFKPAVDKPGYYEFEVNPLNTVLDMFLPSRASGGYERYKADGDFDIQTAVRL